MKKLFSIWLFSLLTCASYSQDLGKLYLQEWEKFYPSKAERSGIHEAIYYFENFEAKRVESWITFNKTILNQLLTDTLKIDPIDARLLRVQSQSEIDLFEQLATHKTSLLFYTQLISRAVPRVLDAAYLLSTEKSKVICERLSAISKLAEAAKNNLENVAQDEIDKGIADLTETIDYLENEKFIRCNQELENAIHELKELQMVAENFSNSSIISKTILGKEEYNRQLQLYTDSNITSSNLEELALQEIETTKGLMVTVAKEYLKTTYPSDPLPNTDSKLIKKALSDMEKDAPLNSKDYLQFWQELADAAVAFIEKNELVTLPKVNTLRIQTAPESAGPAARIGWVSSAPPFDPNPTTTLFLPSIPDTLPKQEQIDFWASFNKPFNRMIVIHELYPGHYTQLKISRDTAHPIRLLFPYGIYIEGWATFTEKVLLDAGWEKENHLTLLAHLRKRLENANRAYTSVQVHCNGWNQEQVLQFSKETALVAPQFAKSLWGRIQRSPMQLTSYFLGAAQFKQLLAYEKKRLGSSFNLKYFMDTIIKAGPIPIDEFYAIFKQARPTS